MDLPLESVAFVCFNVGKGYGGHYLSLAETAQSGIFADPVVVDLGFAKVPLLDAIRTRYIHYGWFRNSAARRTLRDLIAKNGVEIILCYDIPSFLVVQRAFSGKKVKIVYVKCGGPLLTLYYPRPSNLIVYSLEDEAYFSRRLPQLVMARIPSRVREQAIQSKQMPLDPEVPEQKIRRTGERIVCIARISHAYEEKVRRAFDYCQARRDAGQEAYLTVIGAIQHPEVAEALIRDAPADTCFLSHAEVIHDAARFLGQFDSAITTGRGTVEAVFCGLNTLVPFDASQHLALLSPENYAGLMRTNFSGRARSNEVPDRRMGRLSDAERAETLELVRRDYSLEQAGDAFCAFFSQLQPSPNSRLRDAILGWLYLRYVALRERSQIMRSLTRAFRRGRNALGVR